MSKETSEVIGTVEEVIMKGVGKGSGVRIAGVRYGAYDPKDANLENIQEGDRVSLNWWLKGDFKNIAGKVMKVDGDVTASAPPSAPAQSSGSKGGFRHFGTAGGFPVHFEAYEVSVARREAALAVLAHTTVKSPDFDKDIKPLADKIVSYICGWDLIPDSPADSEGPDGDDDIPF